MLWLRKTKYNYAQSYGILHKNVCKTNTNSRDMFVKNNREAIREALLIAKLFPWTVIVKKYS